MFVCPSLDTRIKSYFIIKLHRYKAIVYRVAIPLSPCYNGLDVNQTDLINISDEAWMRHAIALAQQAADEGEVPVGAVAVKNGQVIGQGYNRKEAANDPTAHAEIIALKRSAKTIGNWRLTDVTLFCTLEPCPMCAGAMIQARLSRLVYGARDVRFGADGSVVDVLNSDQFNHQVSVEQGLLESDSAALLQTFFRSLRK
jgi:tRNA(adenine34) deaminase